MSSAGHVSTSCLLLLRIHFIFSTTLCFRHLFLFRLSESRSCSPSPLVFVTFRGGSTPACCMRMYAMATGLKSSVSIAEGPRISSCRSKSGQYFIKVRVLSPRICVGMSTNFVNHSLWQLFDPAHGCLLVRCDRFSFVQDLTFPSDSIRCALVSTTVLLGCIRDSVRLFTISSFLETCQLE